MQPRPFVFGETGDDKRPIGSLLTLQAERAPDRPAVTIDEETASRAELESAANRMARAFAELGVETGDYVAVGLKNSLQFHVVCLALWKLGATPAPISHRLPALEAAAILDLLKPKLVIGITSEGIDPARSLAPDFKPRAELSDAPLPERLARYYKATTSGGSTGRPKVIIDQSAAEFDPTSRGLGIVPDDIVLNSGPLYHNGPSDLRTAR